MKKALADRKSDDNNNTKKNKNKNKNKTAFVAVGDPFER